MGTAKEILLSKGKDESIDYFKNHFKDELDSSINIYRETVTEYRKLTKDPTYPMMLIPMSLLDEYNNAIIEYENRTEGFIEKLHNNSYSEELEMYYREIKEVYFHRIEIISDYIKKDFEERIKKFLLSATSK